MDKEEDPTLEELIKQLLDEDYFVRGDAARSLGKLGDNRAVEPLIATLKDDEGRVKWNTARALGDLGDPRAVEPLKQALKEEQEDYLRNTIKTVLEKLEEPILEELIKQFEARVSEVRSWYDNDFDVVKALIKLGYKRGIDRIYSSFWEFIIEGFWDHNKAFDMLIGLGEKESLTLETIYFINSLKSESNLDVDLLEKVLESIQKKLKTSSRFIKPIINLIGENLEFDDSLESFLIEIEDQTAIEPLLDKLESEDFRVKLSVLKILNEIGDISVIEPLVNTLRNMDSRVRRKAKNALTSLVQKEAIKTALDGYLISQESQKRFISAIVLGLSGEERIIPFLIKIIEDDQNDYDYYEQLTSIEVLIWFIDSGDIPMPDYLPNFIMNIINEVGFIPGVEDTYKEILLICEKIIMDKIKKWDELVHGFETSKLDMETYAELSKDENFLKMIQTNPLFDKLRNDKDSIDEEVAMSIMNIPEKLAKKELKKLEEAHSNLKKSIELTQFVQKEEKAQEDVRTTIRDLYEYTDYPDIHLFEELVEEHHEHAIWGLVHALTDSYFNDYYGNDIYKVFSKMIDEQYLETFAKLIVNEDKYVRMSATMVLGKINDIWSFNLLVETLKDSSNAVRSCAAEALGDLGDPQAVAPLIQVLQKDEDSDVREYVAEALRKLGYYP